MSLRVRWRRAILVGASLSCAGLLIALVPLALATWQARRAAAVAPRVASPQEFQGVLVAVFAGIPFEGEPPPPPAPDEVPSPRPIAPVVLLDATTSICAAGERVDAGCGEVDESDLAAAAILDKGIPLLLRRELAAASRATLSFDCVPTAKMRCASPRSLDALRGEDRWWDAFRRAYPATSGLARISNIVLTRDGNHALLYVSHACGMTCGTGRLVLLERAGATWTIARDLPLWFR